MYLIYQWHPFGSNLSSFHPSFFSFIFSLFSFFSPSLLPSFSPSFLPSLPLSFSSISSKKHIYTNITNLDSVHSCFLPIIIVTACANGEKPALVTLQVFCLFDQFSVHNLFPVSPANPTPAWVPSSPPSGSQAPSWAPLLQGHPSNFTLAQHSHQTSTPQTDHLRTQSGSDAQLCPHPNLCGHLPPTLPDLTGWFWTQLFR